MTNTTLYLRLRANKPPGQYIVPMIQSYFSPVKELRKMNDTVMDGVMEASSTPNNVDTSIPKDFELIVDRVKKRTIFVVHKMVLSCFIPGFDSLMGDTRMQANKLDLPDILIRSSEGKPYSSCIVKSGIVQDQRRILFGTGCIPADPTKPDKIIC